MITLLFYAEAPDANITNIITHWENAVFEWAKNGTTEFPELSIDVLGDKVRLFNWFYSCDIVMW